MGYLGMVGGPGIFDSGPPVDVGTHAIGLLAFHDSYFGIIQRDREDAQLYEVDPETLEITLHGTATPPAPSGSTQFLIGDGGWVAMTDDVIAVFARNDVGGVISEGYSVLTRSGTSISFGAWNGYTEWAAIQDFGMSVDGWVRIDDTHFAVGWSRGGFGPDPIIGSHVAISTVSGDTVSLGTLNDVEDDEIQIIGLLDGSHLLGYYQGAEDLFVHTFSGGAITGTSGRTSVTGAPASSNRYFGVMRAGTSDFLIGYVSAAGGWMQPCTWSGSFSIGTATLMCGPSFVSPNVLYPAGLPSQGDIGGTLDEHVFIGVGSGKVGLGCATQSGASLTPTRHVSPVSVQLGGASLACVPTLHPDNIAVVGLNTSPAYIQAVRCS